MSKLNVVGGGKELPPRRIILDSLFPKIMEKYNIQQGSYCDKQEGKYADKQEGNFYTSHTYRHMGADCFMDIHYNGLEINIKLPGDRDSADEYHRGIDYVISCNCFNNCFVGDVESFEEDLETALEEDDWDSEVT